MSPLLIAAGLAALMLGGKKAMDLSNSADWARFVFSEVTSVLPQVSLRGRVIIVAQAAFESGWGKAAWAAIHGNNLFNITTCQGKSATCADGWTGAYLDQENADWSYRADGSRVRIAQRWRSYPTFRASIEDYWNFINRPKYAAGIPSLIAGDLPGFLTALRAGGYFTLPLYSTPTTQGYVPQMQAVVNTTARFLNVSV